MRSCASNDSAKSDTAIRSPGCDTKSVPGVSTASAAFRPSRMQCAPVSTHSGAMSVPEQNRMGGLSADVNLAIETTSGNCDGETASHDRPATGGPLVHEGALVRSSSNGM